MSDFSVAGALVRHDSDLLLVCNQRRDGRCDWSPPGGVVDPGETVLEALAREVEEETGLIVDAWGEQLYEVRVHFRARGWRLHAMVYTATTWTGELVIDDPDGIVTDAQFVPPDRCADVLQESPAWVREPLLDHLGTDLAESSRYVYNVDGSVGSFRVERLEP